MCLDEEEEEEKKEEKPSNLTYGSEIDSKVRNKLFKTHFKNFSTPTSLF